MTARDPLARSYGRDMADVIRSLDAACAGGLAGPKSSFECEERKPTWGNMLAKLKVSSDDADDSSMPQSSSRSGLLALLPGKKSAPAYSLPAGQGGGSLSPCKAHVLQHEKLSALSESETPPTQIQHLALQALNAVANGGQKKEPRLDVKAHVMSPCQPSVLSTWQCAHIGDDVMERDYVVGEPAESRAMSPAITGARLSPHPAVNPKAYWHSNGEEGNTDSTLVEIEDFKEKYAPPSVPMMSSETNDPSLRHATSESSIRTTATTIQRMAPVVPPPIHLSKVRTVNPDCSPLTYVSKPKCSPAYPASPDDPNWPFALERAKASVKADRKQTACQGRAQKRLQKQVRKPAREGRIEDARQLVAKGNKFGWMPKKDYAEMTLDKLETVGWAIDEEMTEPSSGKLKKLIKHTGADVAMDRTAKQAFFQKRRFLIRPATEAVDSEGQNAEKPEAVDDLAAARESELRKAMEERAKTASDEVVDCLSDIIGDEEVNQRLIESPQPDGPSAEWNRMLGRDSDGESTAYASTAAEREKTYQTLCEPSVGDEQPIGLGITNLDGNDNSARRGKAAPLSMRARISAEYSPSEVSDFMRDMNEEMRRSREASSIFPCSVEAPETPERTVSPCPTQPSVLQVKCSPDGKLLRDGSFGQKILEASDKRALQLKHAHPAMRDKTSIIGGNGEDTMRVPLIALEDVDEESSVTELITPSGGDETIDGEKNGCFKSECDSKLQVQIPEGVSHGSNLDLFSISRYDDDHISLLRVSLLQEAERIDHEDKREALYPRPMLEHIRPVSAFDFGDDEEDEERAETILISQKPSCTSAVGRHCVGQATALPEITAYTSRLSDVFGIGCIERNTTSMVIGSERVKNDEEKFKLENLTMHTTKGLYTDEDGVEWIDNPDYKPEPTAGTVEPGENGFAEQTAPKPSGHPATHIDIDDVLTQYQNCLALSPSPSASTSGSSGRDTVVNRDMQAMREDVGLSPLKLPAHDFSYKHPCHAFLLNTEKAMCFGAHGAPLTALTPVPDDAFETPSHDKAVRTSYRHLDDKYFQPCSTPAVSKPQICSRCAKLCCIYAESLLLSSIPGRNRLHEEIRAKAEETAVNLRSVYPQGLEVFDTFLTCEECSLLVCPQCAVMCEELLCRQVMCKKCGSHGRCSLHD
ncbi:hypothetical protein BAUCODRAFT_36078 [Baudoinia panamericana UAMH 10762]|uniref:Uncharacterized protein n=1 Tax=Baudoinia panamericana (strain UAMH 10762) TaxID=717646 RepID=M2MTF6_BAUPA|nr:uncharacterized protein BAUCODRAFT_36078 [Baudoinia panamericana UAMH 10762]EMC94818.1 hypothetical protein BAUCODRAFT_36078 [Baudoinia panamericana UAMH 10762]